MRMAVCRKTSRLEKNECSHLSTNCKLSARILFHHPCLLPMRFGQGPAASIHRKRWPRKFCSDASTATLQRRTCTGYIPGSNMSTRIKLFAHQSPMVYDVVVGSSLLRNRKLWIASASVPTVSEVNFMNWWLKMRCTMGISPGRTGCLDESINCSWKHDWWPGMVTSKFKQLPERIKRVCVL